MGRLIWLIAAATLLCGCRTQKVASESLTVDTVMVRDTLYGRDSAAVVKAERLSEKMLVKDSTVVTVDAAGKVVRLERYSSVLKDRDRHVSRDSARAVTSGRATEKTGRHVSEAARKEAPGNKGWSEAAVVAGMAALCCLVIYSGRKRS